VIVQQVAKDCGSDLFYAAGPQHLFAGDSISNVELVDDKLLILCLLDLGAPDIEAKVFEGCCLQIGRIASITSDQARQHQRLQQ